MPTVTELSAPYANFMLTPRAGPGVCVTCFNFTRGGYKHCYACEHGAAWLEVVAPISYSVGGEQLHRALVGYKRLTGEVARRLGVELAAVLWRYLQAHERCVARAAGVEAFELVTTVPSGAREHDANHPLRRIVGELVGPTRSRYRPLLRRSRVEVEPRAFDARRFETLEQLQGQPVLLIDDTWTTGASAQSAAAALKHAGAGPVAAIVIGRYLNREWHDADQRLRAMRQPFGWERCAFCS
jgi:hypothetical protein